MKANRSTRRQSSPKAAEIAQRRAKTFELRLAGHSQYAIAEMLGVSQGTVSTDLAHGIREYPMEAISEYRRVSVARLERLLQQVWPDAVRALPPCIGDTILDPSIGVRRKATETDGALPRKEWLTLKALKTAAIQQARGLIDDLVTITGVRVAVPEEITVHADGNADPSVRVVDLMREVFGNGPALQAKNATPTDAGDDAPKPPVQ